MYSKGRHLADNGLGRVMATDPTDACLVVGELRMQESP